MTTPRWVHRHRLMQPNPPSQTTGADPRDRTSSGSVRVATVAGEKHTLRYSHGGGMGGPGASAELDDKQWLGDAPSKGKRCPF